MNKFTGIGRLTKDVELRYTQKGTAVASFTIAINRKFKQEGQPDADFFNCVAWGKLGENISKYMGKGSQMAIVGEVQNRSYEAKDGTKRYVTEINVNEAEFLDSRGASKPKKENVDMNDFEPMDDDDDFGDGLPF